MIRAPGLMGRSILSWIRFDSAWAEADMTHYLDTNRVVAFDTETSGNGHEAKQAMLRVGAIKIVRGRVLGILDLNVQAHDGAEIQDEAIEKNGCNPSEGLDPADAIGQFVDFVYGDLEEKEQFDLFGHRLDFDLRFIRATAARCNPDWEGIPRRFEPMRVNRAIDSAVLWDAGRVITSSPRTGGLKTLFDRMSPMPLPAEMHEHTPVADAWMSVVVSLNLISRNFSR